MTGLSKLPNMWASALIQNQRSGSSYSSSVRIRAFSIPRTDKLVDGVQWVPRLWITCVGLGGSSAIKQKHRDVESDVDQMTTNHKNINHFSPFGCCRGSGRMQYRQEAGSRHDPRICPGPIARHHRNLEQAAHPLCPNGGPQRDESSPPYFGCLKPLSVPIRLAYSSLLLMRRSSCDFARRRLGYPPSIICAAQTA